MADINQVQLPDGSQYNIKDDVSGYATETYVQNQISGITKATIGLGNVDNTSDANKPVSTAQQTALDAKTNTSVIAYTESTATATKRYEIGDQFILNGVLYTATAIIANGGTITVGTNCTASDTIIEQIPNIDGKADKTDLTSISETGSTASQAISAGTYFYLDGTLVRAKTAITNGATFTLNTNYEVISAGALNKITKWNLIGSYGGGTNQDVSIPSDATELIANVKANQYASFSFHIILDAVSSGLNVYRETFYTSASSFTVGNLQITDNVINISGSGAMTNGGAFSGTVTLYYK